MASKLLTLLDTGPLVAFLRAEEPVSRWVYQQFAALPKPLLTCESVLTEAFFLLAREPNSPERIFDFLNSGFLVLDFSIAEEHRTLSALMQKYRDLPMSLADACLVRMAELHPEAKVLTLDSHFRVYRKNGRQAVPVIAP